MSRKIEALLVAIHSELKGIAQYDDSILKSLGSLLFLGQYAVYAGTSIDAEIDNFITLINSYEIRETQHQTFSEGYLSIGTVFRHLVQLELLEESEDLESSIADIAVWSARRELANQNFDLLYGATGILHYLLASNKPGPETRQVAEEYLHCLERNIITLNQGTAWPDHYYRVREQGAIGINLGLAHGVPAILKILTTLYNSNLDIAKESIARLIRSTAVFLMNSGNKRPDAVSIYGGYLVPGTADKEEVSRLGWCYGDLGIGFTLYQAGKAIDDEEVAAYGEGLVLKTTERRSVAQTMVMDAGLCHGTAGIAHMYHKMWHYTGNESFKEAAGFWIQETLNYAIHKEHAAGFKKYNPASKQYETDHGFLEGSAGIGLVLLSYLNGDCSWDPVLMLN